MYTIQIILRTDKVCTLYRLYQEQTRYVHYTDCTDRQGMHTIQIVPRTVKVCRLYRLYQGQTRYVTLYLLYQGQKRYLGHTDCTKDRQGMCTIQIVPRTGKVCTLYRLYQGHLRYVHCTDYTKNRLGYTFKKKDVNLTTYTFSRIQWMLLFLQKKMN